MRSGPALGHSGLFHEAAFYGSDDEFLAVVVPFLRDGVAAGEPTVSLFGPHNQRLVRSVFGPDSGVEFIDGGRHYLRPASAIRRHRDMLTRYVDAGAVQIRIAGDVPHPGVGVPWEWWARYESAVNEVYDEFPMYGLCPYDTRTAPREILDDVQRTATRSRLAGGCRLCRTWGWDTIACGMLVLMDLLVTDGFFSSLAFWGSFAWCLICLVVWVRAG
ncbi:hypothetical protein GCM10020218_080070 [Dactylosporangium vinaceum]